jgi:K(+)-stimulated pyrophosphate-energized sodium pump
LREEPRILTGEVLPDYEKCVEISTKASLKEMVWPGVLVMGTPLILGFFFGPKIVGGLLPGIIISGI